MNISWNRKKNERNDKCNDIRILYTCIILEFNDEINVNSLFIYIYIILEYLQMIFENWNFENVYEILERKI